MQPPLNQNRTKINFRTYLEHIEKDRRHIKLTEPLIKI
jgi:hypothetical protein